MTKQAKPRLIRLGDAKRLTQGENGKGEELITLRFVQAG
jgi:hypothetical protein